MDFEDFENTVFIACFPESIQALNDIGFPAIPLPEPNELKTVIKDRAVYYFNENARSADFFDDFLICDKYKIIETPKGFNTINEFINARVDPFLDMAGILNATNFNFPNIRVPGENPLLSGIFDVGDFLDIAIPARKAIILPWACEKSIVLLSGGRGFGKSNFALGACKAIASGERFGPWETTPTNCLYLDGEMTGDDMQERMIDVDPDNLKSKLKIYCDDIAREKTGIRANFHNDQWREYFKDILLSQEIKFWVADNISSLCPGVDENDKGAWDVINQWAIELKHSGIATWFIHHTGKNGSQRGTSGREDNIDFSLLMEKPKDYKAVDGARFVLKFTKHRTPNRNLHLLSDREFKLLEDDNKRMVWTFKNVDKANKDAIIQLLADGLTVSEIAKELKISKPYVSKIKTANE